MLTAVVLTKNEAENIGECLKHLQWCDQIIVIDDFSTDDTVLLAKKQKVKIVQRHLNNDFAAQRNAALKQVKQGWVLFVDADERVSEKLAHEIQKVIESNSSNKAYRLHRLDNFLGKLLKHGETSTWNQVRLAHSNAGLWQGKVHEVWQIEGHAGEIETPLVHKSHQSLKHFLSKINRYSTLAAEDFFQKGQKSNWMSILAYPVGKFVQNYLLRLGFLDGTHGFVHATCMSFHSFLVRAKLYLLIKMAKKNRNRVRD